MLEVSQMDFDTSDQYPSVGYYQTQQNELTPISGEENKRDKEKKITERELCLFNDISRVSSSIGGGGDYFNGNNYFQQKKIS